MRLDISLLKAVQFCLLCISIHSTSLQLNAAETISVHGRDQQLSDYELKKFLQQHISSQTLSLDKYDAEVWLKSMLSRMQIYKVDRNEALQILRAVYNEATASNLQPDLVLAVIAIESSFNRYAVSHVGAQGLMQVMPFWKHEIGRPTDNLTSVTTNIHYGCKILQYYLKRSKGDLDEALARYNGSYGKTIYSEKVLVAWQQHWQSGRID